MLSAVRGGAVAEGCVKGEIEERIAIAKVVALRRFV
jgi:hypothetical protein